MLERILKLENIKDDSLFLWGSRQTGKSTLLKSLFPKGTSIAHELIEAIIGTIYHPGEKATDQSVNIGEEICSDDQNYLDAHDKAKYLDPYFKEPNIIYDEKSKTYYITDGEREEKLK